MFEPDIVLNYRFDLQMFAAEDEGRTEEPTQYKRKKAREEGNVPKSQELASIILFLLTFWTICIIAGYMFGGIRDILSYFLENYTKIKITQNSISFYLMQMMWMSMRVALPVIVVGFIASILGHVIQTGLLFTPKKISLNLGKLFSNIFPNLKKMFWSMDTAVNTAKSILKFVGVFAILFIIVNLRMGEIINSARISAMQSLALFGDITFQFMSFAGIMLLAFAIGDYAYQRWQHTQSLRMTKQELKEEFKETEGNPEIKAKIQELERRMLSRRMLKDVPTADVIITNPTHIAIAIKYDPNYMNAPVVVAKGEGLMAQQIKEIAKEHNVFIIENKPLAREMFKTVEIGQEIPPDLFVAVAKILSLVYSMRGSVAA